PADLEELGLSTCLKSLIAEWNTRCKGKIRYRLVLDGACEELPEPLPITIFRIVQECLTNIAKHSNAANASVVLEVDSDSLDLLVENDGNAVKPDSKDHAGVGLIGIRERIAALDGKIRIESPPAGGFLVHATIPFQTPGRTQE
ncbi:MAG: sensor histidine kinase, partial [Gammaproteobacteria bacterium]